MQEKVYLTDWQIEGGLVRLGYSDGSEIYVKKTDFDRAFGVFVSAPKEAVMQDFAIDR